MILTIRRFKQTRTDTTGSFELKSGDEVLSTGYTLEPKGDDTIEPNQNRRIPQGVYDVIWSHSPRFNRALPLLFNDEVPKNRHILIHTGNTYKDTQGCILVGDTTGLGVDFASRLFNSRAKFKELESFLKRNDFKVEIINEFDNEY